MVTGFFSRRRSLRRLTATLAVGGALVINTSCSDPANPGAAGAGGFATAYRPVHSAPFTCKVPLSELRAACMPIFDGTSSAVPACSDQGETDIVRCDPLVAYVVSDTATGTLCAYDVSTHELVGAEQFSTVPAFCQGSSVRYAGQLPAPSCPAEIACKGAGEGGAAGSQ